MSDHSILLPNRNCLGIWNVAEKAIYSDSNYAAMHGQTLRQPNTDSWVYKVDQVVFNYASADAAKQFFVLSADRWSKCTNHKVNMNVNNQQMPTVSFGQLTRTDTKLTMNADPRRRREVLPASVVGRRQRHHRRRRMRHYHHRPSLSHRRQNKFQDLVLKAAGAARKLVHRTAFGGL